MIELIQFPWSPFCIVQRRILEYSGARHKITNIPSTDRSLVWRLTRNRYYAAPIIRDGSTVVFELNDVTQIVAKYLDNKLKLNLFPADTKGVQSILWRYIESEIECPCFKLNDTYYREFVPKPEQLAFLRHKERRFGRDCIEQWTACRKQILAELQEKLVPFEMMLQDKPFLLGPRPQFVDFDLFGMLGNLLYTGHYRLPSAHTSIRKWHKRMASVQIKSFSREEELHP